MGAVDWGTIGPLKGLGLGISGFRVLGFRDVGLRV